MATFKKSYLPSQSQPWAKQVEDKVDTTERSLKSLDVNNRSKDEQFSASLNRLDGAVIEARSASELADAAQNTAIAANNAATTANANAISALQGLGSLDEATSTYKINASNLTVGTLNGDRLNGETITGVTITGGSLNTTQSSLKNVEISGSSAYFKYNGGIVGEVTSDSAGRLLVSGNSGLYLNSGAAGSTHFGTGGFAVGDSADLSILNGALKLGTLSGGSYIISSFIRNATGQMEGPGFRATGDVNVSGDIFYAADTGTGDIAYFSGNKIVKGTSSARYKQQIQEMPVLDEILTMPLKTFKYNSEVERDGDDAPKLYGYIAEELHDLGLTDFVTYEEQEDGTVLPNGVRQISILTALHRIVQEQDKTIKDLNTRIEALEAK